MFPGSVTVQREVLSSFNFKYIEHSVCGPGVNIDFSKSMYAGCSCVNCHNDSCTCIMRYGQSYDPDGALLKGGNTGYCLPVFECNSNCMCSAVCTNRVTQKDTRIELEIFQTNNRGLGVRALKAIPTGSYICEYCGEVVSYKEAKERASKRANENNYLLVLKEHIAGNNVLRSHIDATKHGNVARFMNHSCEPNMELVAVRDNTPVPKLCLFAARAITTGEELTFSYGDGGSYNNDAILENMTLRKECLCGASSCLKYLPFDQSLFLDT